MILLRNIVIVFGLVALTFSLHLQSDELLEGQALAKSKGCFECHGKSGNTFWNDSPPYLPKIANMPSNYLISAMKDYRSGTRQHKQMTPLMENRTDEEIELLGKYYSAQERY